MTTAFVLSGGASLASVQVGMLQALEEAGVRPDFLVGTSAGAFNAAWAAGDPAGGELPQLEDIWLGLRRQDVFPSKAAMVLGGILGRRNHLFSSDGLERLVRKHIGYRRLEQAPTPVHIVATEVLTGREILVSSDRAVGAGDRAFPLRSARRLALSSGPDHKKMAPEAGLEPATF